MANKKTRLGIQENLEGLLCYIGAWVTGIIFLIIEKENQFVRFHAMQSLITFLGLFVIGIVSGFIPIIGVIINLLLSPLGLILWLYLMYQAYQGKEYELPIVGKIARDQLSDSGSEQQDEIDVDYRETDNPDSEEDSENKEL
ncbi:MAG: DUF4870 domain-containing protein [Candidatus Woesearchaeota archaeon]